MTERGQHDEPVYPSAALEMPPLQSPIFLLVYFKANPRTRIILCVNTGSRIPKT